MCRGLRRISSKVESNCTPVESMKQQKISFFRVGSRVHGQRGEEIETCSVTTSLLRNFQSSRKSVIPTRNAIQAQYRLRKEEPYLYFLVCGIFAFDKLKKRRRFLRITITSPLNWDKQNIMLSMDFSASLYPKCIIFQYCKKGRERSHIHKSISWNRS